MESVSPFTHLGVQTMPALNDCESSGVSTGELVITIGVSDSKREGSPTGVAGPPNEVGRISVAPVRAEVGLA